jgi:hypothetical protein
MGAEIIQRAWKDILTPKVLKAITARGEQSLQPPFTLLVVQEKQSPYQDCQVFVSQYDSTQIDDVFDKMLCGTKGQVIQPPVLIFLSGVFKPADPLRGEIDGHGVLHWLF